MAKLHRKCNNESQRCTISCDTHIKKTLTHTTIKTIGHQPCQKKRTLIQSQVHTSKIHNCHLHLPHSKCGVRQPQITALCLCECSPSRQRLMADSLNVVCVFFMCQSQLVVCLCGELQPILILLLNSKLDLPLLYIYLFIFSSNCSIVINWSLIIFKLLFAVFDYNLYKAT